MSFHKNRQTRRASRRHPFAATYRPGIESLEDRRLLSAGDLDLTFGNGGLVNTTLGSSSRALAVATYPNAGTANDGKIVAAGDAFPATGKTSVNIAVARYNLDGTLDPTFGGTGAVITIPGRALAVLVQPDGKVLAAGQSSNDFIVVRYNVNGTLDTTFGTKGKVVTTISRSSNDAGHAMVLQADGKIVVAGITNPQNTNFEDLALLRYNTNGTLDTTFGTGGKVVTRLATPLMPGYTNSKVNLAIDRNTSPLNPNSGTLVVGAKLQGGSVVVRYSTSGTLDTSFGSATAHPGYVNLVNLYNPAVVVQSDDRIVIAGIVTDTTTGLGDIGLHRLNPDGTLDTSFDSDGIVITSSPPNETVEAVTIQADGKIVVAGDHQIDGTTGGQSFFVARYDTNGMLESTFGTNGIATAGANGGGQTKGVALEPDGRIVVAGYTSGQFPGAFSLARFLGDTAVQAPSARQTQPVATTPAQGSADYGQLPLSFEANLGQTDTQVNFLSRGSGYTLFLTPDEAVLSLGTGRSSDVVRMHIVGANPAAQVAGLEEQASRTNYLLGDDPSQWLTDVANYGKVEYQEVYSGINLVYYGNQRRLEYDFVVAPGADPNVIRLAFDGVRSMELDGGGNLILHTGGGDLVKDAPVIYQEIEGVRQSIAGRYVLDDGQVQFEVGLYDHALPLVIDPILSYSTYLGGSGNDRGSSIAVDAAGNAYVTGSTTSVNFPTKNPVQASQGNAGNGWDVFVTKLNAAGSAVVYSTFLGGSLYDGGLGIALFTDVSGTSAVVTGNTNSLDFPTANALQPARGGDYDAFVAKLTPSGSALVYSTYLGGSGKDNPFDTKGGIAVDAAGNAYVAGHTQSTNFPIASAFQSTLMGGSDAFLTKLSPAGALVYSTYFGGSAGDGANAVAVDTSGNAYLTGWTWDVPITPGAFQSAANNTIEAFVTKFNAAGSALVYSTYLGGNGDERGYGIAVGSGGNAYVTGYTYSTNFPTLNAFQSAKGGGQDGFVTALNATGTALVYSSYLGGSADDQGYGIAVDVAGNAYVIGETDSTNFTAVNAFQPAFGGGSDAFVTNVSATGAALFYSSFLGGNDWDRGQGIAVDGAGNGYVTGFTYSRNFPTTTNPMQSLINGKKGSKPVTISDAFVTKIGPPAAVPLLAVGSGNVSRDKTLAVESLQPLLVEAGHRWQDAGVDVSALHGIDLRIADLGGTTLGLASGNTIWLDNNAAGWGWFVDATPGSDSEFTTLGNQGEQNRMDLLTVVMHELGHLLGHDHNEEGVMAETLAAGVRRTGSDQDDVSLADQIFQHGGDHRSDAWLGAWLNEQFDSAHGRAKRRR